MPDPLRIVSYGGGVQSTALLVLAARRYIDFPVFVFANVGADSEHPATMTYVREIAFDYAAAHGIEMHEVEKTKADGTVQTVRGEIMVGNRQIIPFRGQEGNPLSRSCTAEFKVRVIGAWLRARGATAENPAVVGIGFSTDEVERSTMRRTNDYERPEFPLLNVEWKGRRGLSRSDCEQVIRDAGLPVPPKSSCYFCPFHRLGTWRELARNEPDLFADAVAIERHANEIERSHGRTRPLFLTRFGKPLDEVIDDSQQAFDFEGPEGCDEGYCWT